MIESGRIQFFRSAFTHPVVGIARPLRFALWLWMTADARFKNCNGLERGQFRTSDRELRAVVGMADSTFRGFKADLIAAGMVDVQRGAKHRDPSTWTIQNYERFQCSLSAGSLAGPFALPSPSDGVVVDDVCDDPKQTPRGQSRAADDQPKKEGFRKKVLEVTPQPPKGGTGDSSKLKRARGAKPAIKALGEWPAVEANQKWKEFPYPAEFETVWGIWRGVGKKNAEVRRMATGKPGTYRLCLRWLHGGLTGKQIADATRLYLQPFYNDPGKTHCKLPSTLYSHANPILPDLCDDSEASSLVSGRTSFKYAHSALRAAGVAYDRDAMPSQLWAQWDALSDEVKAKACAGRGV